MLYNIHVKEGYTLAEDLEKPDGIAVVGFFMKIGKIGRKMENFERVIRYGNRMKKLIGGLNRRSRLFLGFSGLGGP
ncbi:unnamed protein product [Meloidogyne enterolobii]|uniref:Uncharacterized protein n=1 Tax=Meloidogyne enterolobii TaxID=390850 RepID=A0ACB1ABU9_MELEN